MTGRIPPTSPTAHHPPEARTTMPESPHDLISDPTVAAFFTLHGNLARQGPGSDASIRHLLSLAGPPAPRPRVPDIGCGPGRSSLVLAQAGAEVTVADLHQPYLDELARTAADRGLVVHTVRVSMTDLPFPDESFDLIWAEGSAYFIGFDTALRSWRRLLAPGGRLVVTECEWSTDSPSAESRAFWDQAYPLRTREHNIATAHAAGYAVAARHTLADRDWFEEYHTPLSQRAHAADLVVPGMREAVAATLQEITMRREHGADYQYTGYVLHPQDKETNPIMTSSLTTRPESAGDVAIIRDINLAAFPTPLEADLIEALRADPQAWLAGLSWLAEAPGGELAGYALLTRCHVGDSPALTLGPCAVKPDHQRRGAGSAAIRAALQAAREQGENLVLVLGHAEYYPRFGFTPASGFGIRPPFDVEDKYMMALALNPEQPVPSGVIRYPAAFGV
ncbi:GNAT family N-acetyltransferase [Nonomuraea zeae]|uniref:GNAT family N-acetyltransferase n=2 Tax=Streptosporangiales TaxID=85012 RepID=A0A5S4GB91_9ACTN|nr:GNAT family N-acetyltransferase [Nonomuraea zeae]